MGRTMTRCRSATREKRVHTFRNKVAAITGAGSGIGRALALELASRGCHLALADLDPVGLAETAKAARDRGVRVAETTLDVSDRAAMFAWADATVRELGQVNLIFNNAGVALTVPLEDVRIEDFQWIMNINFWGVVHGTQAFLPHLRASGDGHVINISSLFGIMCVPTQGTYNASKFAVRGFTEALRLELELEGAPVSATCIHPGGVATQIAQSGRIDPRAERLTGLDPETHRRRSNQLINVTRPDEAALQILSGVERNARRVLVGRDAKILDALVRLFGSGYQKLILRRARKLDPRRSAAARPSL